MLLNNLEIILQLSLAGFLGGIVGIEREYRKKEAGFRTYTLTSLGAALFTIISIESFFLLSGTINVSFDPSRIVGQIVLGTGFLGAGLIVYRQSHVEGLTTAAGLWVAAAIGTAIGFHLYFPAIFVTFFTVLVLAGLRIVEEKIFKKEGEKDSFEK